jgi:hypothetical protein
VTIEAIILRLEQTMAAILTLAVRAMEIGSEDMYAESLGKRGSDKTVGSRNGKKTTDILMVRSMLLW